MRRYGEEQPETLVGLAVEAAMDAITGVLGERGARAQHVVIMLQVQGAPETEGDCTTSVQGFLEPEDAMREIAAHALNYARVMGIDPTGSPG